MTPVSRRPYTARKSSERETLKALAIFSILTRETPKSPLFARNTGKQILSLGFERLWEVQGPRFRRPQELIPASLNLSDAAKFLAPIGAGGMGEVYRARDTKLGCEVAIKVLPDTFAKNPERLARFKREAKLLASLNYLPITTIYGIEESNGTHYLFPKLSRR